MNTRDFVGGAIIGVGVSLGMWFIIRNFIENKLVAGSSDLRTQIDQQVPPLVKTAVQEKLSEANLTPDTGARISRLLAAAERGGLI